MNQYTPNTTTHAMTTEYREPRPTLSAGPRRVQQNGQASGFANKPFHKNDDQHKSGKKPGQRNLEPNERMLAVAKREGRTIHISLASVDDSIIGKVVDFGKYEIVVELGNGELLCVFKSDISTFIIKRQVQ